MEIQGQSIRTLEGTDRTSLLVVILASISLIVFAVTSYLSYQTSVSHIRDSLSEIAFSRAQLIRSVLDIDTQQSLQFPDGSLAATLYQLDTAQSGVSGFGETREFLLARRDGDFIEFLVEQSFRNNEEPISIPWEGEFAEPMRQAISGRRGSIVDLDYRGVSVLAAYAPVGDHNLGVVIKMDQSEIVEPYIKRGLLVGLGIIALVAFGAYSFCTVANPMINRLLVSEARLEEAQRISQMGNWEWIIATGELYWSDQIFRIYGEQPNSFKPTYEELVARTHQEDRVLIEKAVEASLIDPDQNFSVGHRIILPNGEFRFVREQGEVVRDTSGNPIRMVGVVIDVTQFRAVQQSLTLFEKAMQSIEDAVVIMDLNGITRDCNDAYLKITGHQRDDVIGHKLRIGEDGVISKLDRQKIIEITRAEGEWRGELWDKRKNGEYYPIEASLTTIYDEQERPTHVVISFRDMSHDLKQKRALERLAYFDELTGLPNRAKITRVLQERIDRLEIEELQIGICLLDIDEFKTLNTSLGHRLGDELLRQVAGRLKNCLDSQDDVARFGGDEFLVIVNNLTDERTVQMVLDQVFIELGAPFIVESTELQLGVSAGVALYPMDGSDADTLISNAELALEDYRSKELRGFQFFTESMQVKAKKRRDMESSIRDGLLKDEFILHYQPKLDLCTKRVVGAESLVRWQREDGRLVPPIDFIPIAESTGLIVPMGNQILSSALAFCKHVNTHVSHDFQMAINLSPRQFIEKNLVETIAAVIQLTGVSPENLELEITESTAMIGVDHMIDTLAELRDLGCSIAIDDFGTGFSSLSYLNRFPIDTLKIDRAFVMGVTDREGDAEMARAIVAMAKSLNLKLVAEGIETEGQLNFFTDLGCDVMQGYLFSKPLPEGEFLNFTTRENKKLKVIA